MHCCQSADLTRSRPGVGTRSAYDAILALCRALNIRGPGLSCSGHDGSPVLCYVDLFSHIPAPAIPRLGFRATSEQWLIRARTQPVRSSAHVFPPELQVGDGLAGGADSEPEHARREPGWRLAGYLLRVRHEEEMRKSWAEVCPIHEIAIMGRGVHFSTPRAEYPCCVVFWFVAVADRDDALPIAQHARAHPEVPADILGMHDTESL